MFRELREMGAHPEVNKELPSPPCMGHDTSQGCLCIPGDAPPFTWVLRGGIGQEKPSSRAVAGAVEQDGHSAGVCRQEWGRRDGVPAVGPCQQG